MFVSGRSIVFLEHISCKWISSVFCIDSHLNIDILLFCQFTALLREHNEMTANRAIAEVSIAIAVLVYILYLSFSIFAIIKVNGEGYRDVDGSDFYWFGCADIVAFGALSYAYKHLLVINVFVLISAVTLSLINLHGSDSSADVDALGALFSVAILVVNLFVVFMPAVRHLLGTEDDRYGNI